MLFSAQVFSRFHVKLTKIHYDRPQFCHLTYVYVRFNSNKSVKVYSHEGWVFCLHNMHGSLKNKRR